MLVHIGLGNETSDKLSRKGIRKAIYGSNTWFGIDSRFMAIAAKNKREALRQSIVLIRRYNPSAHKIFQSLLKRVSGHCRVNYHLTKLKMCGNAAYRFRYR